MLNITDVILSIIYIFPAYVANGTPVVVYRLLNGKTTPIDRGIIAWDGQRLLGDGKSIEGFVSGTIIGSVTGFVISFLMPYLYKNPIEYLLLSIGAMTGDLIGSFIKRRLKMERGAPFPLIDQTGFITIALLLVWMMVGLPNWIDLELIFIILIITFILHIATNILAYIVGIKNKPW
ncbi:MAG: CDP-2,3-bis-(O-geranylgeranyl)-sn-glycerol synthase [Thermoprotei archaeon]